MNEPSESGKPEPKPTRLEEARRMEEARRIIGEYANDLREIIRKLREKMN